MFRKKWPWVVGLLVVLGAAAAAYSRSRQEKGTLITAETVQKRDLEGYRALIKELGLRR